MEHMTADSTEKKSPFKDAKVKKNPSTTKEFWEAPDKAKKEAEKIQKFKKNNPATLNEPFDVQQ